MPVYTFFVRTPNSILQSTLREHLQKCRLDVFLRRFDCNSSVLRPLHKRDDHGKSVSEEMATVQAQAMIASSEHHAVP